MNLKNSSKLTKKRAKKIRISKYDKEWASLVKQRDGYKCSHCGKKAATRGTAAHHFIRRGIKSCRLLIENGVTLCASCHNFNHEFSAHKTPEAFKRWFKEKYPERYEYLIEREKLHMTEREAIEEFTQMTQPMEIEHLCIACREWYKSYNHKIESSYYCKDCLAKLPNK